jgi:hypothetical protein
MRGVLLTAHSRISSETEFYDWLGITILSLISLSHIWHLWILLNSAWIECNAYKWIYSRAFARHTLSGFIEFSIQKCEQVNNKIILFNVLWFFIEYIECLLNELLNTLWYIEYLQTFINGLLECLLKLECLSRLDSSFRSQNFRTGLTPQRHGIVSGSSRYDFSGRSESILTSNYVVCW